MHPSYLYIYIYAHVQISLMRNYTVFVSPGGGMSFVGAFLAEGAAFIQVDYWCGEAEGAYMHARWNKNLDGTSSVIR